MAAQASRVISADSHVLEPPDLWTKRIDPEYRDRAPHVVREKDRDLFKFEGMEARNFGGFGRPDGDKGAAVGLHFEDVRPGGWNPDVRLEDMALDGVQAEVVYPSLGMQAYSLADPGLQLACLRAYNDWLGEFCGAHPDQLCGVALVPLLDVDAGVKELRRAVKLGLRGACVWADPPDEINFASKRYDPFWAEAESMGIPVSMHSFTGKDRNRASKPFLSFYTCAVQPLQESLANIIFSGVLERFPKLRIVSVENDLGWAGYLMQRMDYGYQRKGPRFGIKFASGVPPGEQFRQHVRCTFMQDSIGMRNLQVTGPDVAMWASDYPHSDSTWPHSQQIIKQMMGSISPEAREKVLYSNAAEWYGLRVPEIAAK